MAERASGADRPPHQGGPDAASLPIRKDGERTEQQRGPAIAGRDVPQPDGAHEAAVLGRHQGKRGRPALAQPLGGFCETDRAVGDVEQRFARRGVGRSFWTDADHGLSSRPGTARHRVARSPGPRLQRAAQMWKV